MKLVALIVAVLAVASAAVLVEENYQYLFTRFIKEHNKVYDQSEFFARFNIFKANLDKINEINAKKHNYHLKMNEFGDMTPAEFKAKMLRTKNIEREYIRSQNYANLSMDSIPASVDWRTKNAVTAVKNQGQCGSCWSFSTTGSVEGINAIKTGKLVSLSEQQLMDCSTAEGNQGCNGGLMDYAFEYIIKNNGICSEASYPYTAADGTCHACTNVATISGYKNVPTQNEPALQAAVVNQPVSVAIEADQFAFQFYGGGVFDASCGTALDHGVLVVGYGFDTSSNLDFWIVKNSWGASWGESGYIRMVRGTKVGTTGECGIALQPSFPTK